MEIKYRYRKNGSQFIPQYKREVNNEDWRDFVASDIKGDMKRLCQSIGDIQAPQRWDCGIWYYKDDPHTLLFTKEVFVMAFLGAAKSFYSDETKELDI